MRLKIKLRRNNRKSFFLACLCVLISLGFVHILILIVNNEKTMLNLQSKVLEMNDAFTLPQQRLSSNSTAIRRTEDN